MSIQTLYYVAATLAPIWRIQPAKEADFPQTAKNYSVNASHCLQHGDTLFITYVDKRNIIKGNYV